MASDPSICYGLDMMENSTKPSLKIILAAPRGFCAGVDRAIQIVEKAIEKYGSPVYVRHEIVHNKYVVDGLRAKGAVFVEELSEIPDDGQPVIFSAHGVAKAVPELARARQMFFIDATCPLVTKVHNEAEQHFHLGRLVILVGHGGHPEVIGTMGQLPFGAVCLVETLADVEKLELPLGTSVAYCTQTTLSLDDTASIVDALKQKFPAIVGPQKDDICYATTNRQAAVKEIAPKVEALFVIGSPNSSNSNRLVEVAKNYGCPSAFLVQGAADIPWDQISTVSALGLTAGASAPEVLVKEVIAELRTKYDVKVEENVLVKENILFNIPRILRDEEECSVHSSQSSVA
jgi:4-hydroxy-3-methylbut-2-enyl diphosphate reductase